MMIRTFAQWEDEGESVDDASLILDPASSARLQQLLAEIDHNLQPAVSGHRDEARAILDEIAAACEYRNPERE
jgi:hypothetical protein